MLREAADAIEMIFKRIVDGLKTAWRAVKDVVDWLKQRSIR